MPLAKKKEKKKMTVSANENMDFIFLFKIFMANLIQQNIMEDSFSLSLKAIKNDKSST